MKSNTVISSLEVYHVPVCLVARDTTSKLQNIQTPFSQSRNQNFSLVCFQLSKIVGRLVDLDKVPRVERLQNYQSFLDLYFDLED